MARRRKGRPITGVLLVDKPLGFSSNGLLQKVRWLYQAQKAGHTGALDPAATGLLPICFGEATKFTRFLLDADKQYLTTGVLGVSTDTLDAEGNVTAQKPVPELSSEDIVQLIDSQFIGETEQVPPMYSALKRDGRKLYELAREGVELELESRPVTLYENQLIDWNTPELTLQVTCSKGTYIRTLVNDIGDALGCGGHVKTLRRLQHGKFHLDQAITLDQLIAMQEAGEVDQMDSLLISVDELLSELPRIDLDESKSRFFSHGNDVQFDHAPVLARVYRSENGVFMGVGRVSDTGRLQPERLISSDST